ncbi:recQ-mediated genome instability protein 2 isoform X2 [Colius striatus]|uniref:recQ-mediated genome instability protein 2 isoform X2 n=1 Tax=Colius striatus TaxID=57412 RepID=UPI002B1D5011|nr:recQ-mediated genome instability protein 2 isoform X2 [Colius striatus]
MRGNGKKSDQASNVGSFNMTRAALLKATGSVWTEQEHSPLVRNRAGGNPFRKHWERECQERPARRHQGKTHVSEDGLEDQRMNEEASPITFSSVSFGWNFCLPQRIVFSQNPSEQLLTNQDGGKKRGLENTFATTQMFTQTLDLAEMSIKGIALNDSVNTILYPLSSTGECWRLLWSGVDQNTTDFPAKEELEVPECK